MLNSVIPCGRCHGVGAVDFIREAIDKRREDEEFMARIEASVAKHAELLKRLA